MPTLSITKNAATTSNTGSPRRLTIWALTQCPSKKAGRCCTVKMIRQQRRFSIVTDDSGQRRGLQKPTSVTCYPVRSYCWAEAKMVTLRIAVPAILATAAAAGCFSYFVIITLPARFATDARLLDVRLPPAALYSPGLSTGASKQIDQPSNADELLAAAAYQKPPRRS